MAELVLDVVETTDDNVAFSRVLLQWLARRGVDGCEGVVIVAMVSDGFELLQFGDHPMSTGEIQRYMGWVGRQLEAAV